MKNYQKPVLEVVELAVAENIAALVPKTIYKRSVGKKMAQDTRIMLVEDLSNLS